MPNILRARMSEPEVHHAGLRASDATIAWCLRRALNLERLGEFEQAALWAHVAAGTASEFGHSWLTSAPLESLLLRIGYQLPGSPVTNSGEPRGTTRWLHVF